MRYVSTRGAAPALSFADVLLSGLAPDGGLYVPETWPRFDRAALRALRGRSYAEIVAATLKPLVADAIGEADLARLCAEAYRGFAHPAVAPLRQLGPDEWLLELIHGPTLSFKDYALQVVGRLFDHVLAQRSQRVTIVAATSGDTGSAAIEACRDRAALTIVVLHPKGRVSEVQRRQMTTAMAPNVHNVAVEGTFDDCQDLVKRLFADREFRARSNLSAMNSINWARIAVQVAYYMAAAVALGAPDRGIAFAVPTGNFGNVYSAWAARRMGLPIERLVIGCNRNDIVARFFAAGDMALAEVVPTLSPSMDIQVSSNFERLLFEQMGRKGARVAAAMEAFRRDRRMRVPPARLAALQRLFTAEAFDDEATKATIRAVLDATGVLVDPHTAIGIEAGRRRRAEGVPLVAVATAHPAKFPDAVEAATGVRPALPPRLADLGRRPERVSVLPADYGALRDFVDARIGERAAA